jgi:hypothetical protein
MMSISKFLLAAAIALSLSATAQAADAPAKKPLKTKSAKAAAKPAAKEPNEEADEPSTEGSAVVNYDCELGNKVTIYQNASDEDHIALRWKKKLHRLTRIGTTTGAERFENHLYGLVWIGIPAKAMLLDSKQGHQLANECKSTEQQQSAAAAAPEAGKL